MEQLNQSEIVTLKAALAAHQTSLTAPPSYSGTRYNLENSEEGASGSALMEYWRILRRNARSIILASLSGLIIGFAIGIPMQPVYQAKTSLEVLHLNDDFMNLRQANPTTTNDYSDDASEEQTQANLLQSASVLDRVVSKLESRPGEAAERTRIATTGWRSILHLAEPLPQTAREQVIVKAATTVKVKPTPHTRVLVVTVDSTDPKLAQDFANTLSQEFIAQNMEARWDTTQRTSEWLRRELDDARDKLRISEDALQTYARGSGLIFTDETTNVATEKLQQVQQALSQATTERITNQSRYQLAQNSPPDSLADVLNDPSMRETQSKMTDLRRQIADLSAVFNPEYPKIQRLKAELEALEYAFESSRADILTRIKNDFQEASSKEKLLADTYNAQAQNVAGQDEKAIQYNILKRDVDSNRQLYDTMLQQMKQSSIASAMRASNVRVVDQAKLPTSAVSPNFQLNSALGMIAGLLLSVVFVSIRERADRSLQQPGDVKQWLDIPEIGTIPSTAIEGRNPYYGPRAMPQNGSSALNQSPETVELATFQKKPSLIAEAFRSALTSILFVGENGNRPRVLVFTSANAADGKTTVASNLAIAAAEIRCKVLVIDADLRRPRMHKIFNVPNEQGLTTLLEEGTGLRGLVCKTNIPNLDVLPAGPATHAAAHLLYSPNFKAAIDEFREEYDMILIDTPPMLQMTDARVAGRLADAVILVVRSGRTTRDALIAAKDRLAEDRIRVLGTILNDWNPKLSPNGYYGYYGYSQSRYTKNRYAPNDN